MFLLLWIQALGKFCFGFVAWFFEDVLGIWSLKKQEDEIKELEHKTRELTEQLRFRRLEQDSVERTRWLNSLPDRQTDISDVGFRRAIEELTREDNRDDRVITDLAAEAERIGRETTEVPQSQSVIIGYRSSDIIEGNNIIIGYSAGQVMHGTPIQKSSISSVDQNFPPPPLDVKLEITTPLRPIQIVKPKNNGD